MRTRRKKCTQKKCWLMLLLLLSFRFVYVCMLAGWRMKEHRNDKERMNESELKEGEWMGIDREKTFFCGPLFSVIFQFSFITPAIKKYSFFFRLSSFVSHSILLLLDFDLFQFFSLSCQWLFSVGYIFGTLELENTKMSKKVCWWACVCMWSVCEWWGRFEVQH